MNYLPHVVVGLGVVGCIWAFFQLLRVSRDLRRLRQEQRRQVTEECLRIMGKDLADLPIEIVSKKG